jgi:serine/threonine-protein kinase HipA
MRSLNGYIDHRLVGALHEGDDLWRFEYDEQWAEALNGFDLAPGLPRARRMHADGGTNGPVQWYFDNLLPDELLRQAISKEVGINGEDAFARSNTWALNRRVRSRCSRRDSPCPKRPRFAP